MNRVLQWKFVNTNESEKNPSPMLFFCWTPFILRVKEDTLFSGHWSSLASQKPTITALCHSPICLGSQELLSQRRAALHQCRTLTSQVWKRNSKKVPNDDASILRRHPKTNRCSTRDTYRRVYYKSILTRFFERTFSLTYMQPDMLFPYKLISSNNTAEDRHRKWHRITFHFLWPKISNCTIFVCTLRHTTMTNEKGSSSSLGDPFRYIVTLRNVASNSQAVVCVRAYRFVHVCTIHWQRVRRVSAFRIKTFHARPIRLNNNRRFPQRASGTSASDG